MKKKTSIIFMMFFLLLSLSLISMANGETIFFKENPFVLLTTIGQKIYIKKAEIRGDDKLLYLTFDGRKGSIKYGYIQNFDDIISELNRQRDAESLKIAAEKIVSEKKHKDTVNSISICFSPWDGSHRQLEKLIIKSMNDPDSYKHDKTEYSILENGNLFINTYFRGKNKFGGYVRNAVTAESDVNCNIVKIIQQGSI